MISTTVKDRECNGGGQERKATALVLGDQLCTVSLLRYKRGERDRDQMGEGAC